MNSLTTAFLARLGAVGLGFVLVGCADDTPSATSSFGTGGTGLADTAGQISATLVYETGLDDTGDESSDDAAEPGQSQSALVGAGTRASSSNYSVVFTFGQPTAHQGTHASDNYQLQGGLIGANGSPPQ